MKLIIQNSRIAAVATDAYVGPDEFITAPDDFDHARASDYVVQDGELVLRVVVPQEVTMGQCRLALFDLHAIETDEQFLALTDLLPEDQRARARLELRTRPTVQIDNPLVVAVCDSVGWDREALFVYAGAQ